MAKLKAMDIENFAKLAGFSGKDADIATAVALAESGGDTNAHRTQGKDDSYGLWQINMLGALGPDRRKRYNIGKNTDLFNPEENARVAYAVYKDSGWDAWSTYKNGAYKTHMGDTEGLDAIPGSTGDSLRGKDLGDVLPSVIDSLGSTLFKSLANLTGAIIGIVLIVLAVVVMVLNSKSAKSAVKTAAKVVA